MRVESKQRSTSSALQRASRRARGRGRTLVEAVHGTLTGLRKAREVSVEGEQVKVGRPKGERCEPYEAASACASDMEACRGALYARLSRSEPRRVRPDERKWLERRNALSGASRGYSSLNQGL